MLYLSALVFLPLTLAAVSRVEQRATCDDVHLFLARGRGESYPGRVGGLADAVCGGLSSCSYENILFTSVASTLYCDSAAEGAANGVAQIAAYHASCPNSKLVIGGYSLGAQIVGDMLGGGGGNFFNCAEGTSQALDPNSPSGKAIAAVILFGDTRHVANQPYNVGSGSALNGQYPRSGGQLAGLNAFSSKIQSYCVYQDPVCALGNDGHYHETYVTVYGATAGAWVQAKVKNAPAPPPPTISSSSSSSVAIASSTTSGSVSVSATGTSSGVTGPASSSSSLTPFDFSSTITSAPASSPTGNLIPFVFSSTSLSPVTAASIAPLATATSVPASPFGTSVAYTIAVGTGTGVAPVKSTSPTSTYYGAGAPTPSAFSGAGNKAMGYSLSLVGLAGVGALLL